MKTRQHLDVIRVNDDPGRQLALSVMRETYRNEKNWIQDDEKLVSSQDVTAANISWFVARLQGSPVGVLRVLYDPPLQLYAEYGFELAIPGLNLNQFIRSHRIAEIGRFAVLPEHRSNPLIAPALIREAGSETVFREYSHYITDVFEGEPHSPYRFHTRVLGFQVVATHEVGELNCPNRRLTMILNIPDCYRRLEQSRNWFYRFLTENWTPAQYEKLRRLPAESLPSV